MPDIFRTDLKKLILDGLTYINPPPFGSKVDATYVLGGSQRSLEYKYNVRLKRSGAWWYITNANNILKLRCAKYNNTYDSIVRKYIAQDREKNYDISSIK